jgi:WD40 repeat protein
VIYLFATATADMIVRLWDGELKEEIAALEDYDSQANELTFTSDGAQLIYTATDGIRVWNIRAVLQRDGKLNDFRIIASPTEGEFIQSIALNPNGTVLAVGYQDGAVRLWNMETGEQLVVLEGHEGRVVSLAFNPDGTLLASGGTDGTVRLWGAPAAA